MPAAIEIAGVTKTYGRHRGVADISLTVAEGEVFGYLGPNGAGKTTTIRLLLDLIRPNSGTLRVLGRSPREPELRRHIGYLPGELNLYGNYTGAELIAYFDNLRGNSSGGRAQALAERLALDLSRPIRDLSKGNKQKVGVVQAFMHQPRLLILDEPTSGLDPLIQQAFFDLVAEAQAAGSTVFLSSHVLSEVERIAGRIGIIREGRIVEVETLDALRRRAVRQFEVTFAADVPAAALADVPGVSDMTLGGRVLTCRVTGSVDPFIKAIAAFPVANITSQGADLEALFMAYYRGEAHAA